MQTTTQGTSAAPGAAGEPEDGAAHVLPPWFDFVQEHVFLSALILAEAYLLGTLMAYGWVRNIESPGDWGVYHGIGVVLFFAAGAMAAGIALRTSIKAAACFKRHEWGFALFNFTGVLIFAVAEVWTSLSERSANLSPTPADSAVLSLLGISGLPVSPTVVIVALLLPFTTIYYGFSQQRGMIQTAEQLERDAETTVARLRADAMVKRVKAEVNANVRAAQMRGLRATVAAARGAGEPTDEPDGPDPDGSDPDGGPSGGFRAVSGAAETMTGVRPVAWINSGEMTAMRNTDRGAECNAAARSEAWMQARRRVRLNDGRLTARELQDVLGVGDSYARDLLRRVESCERAGDGRHARWEAPARDVIHALLTAKSDIVRGHGSTLRDALYPRKRARSGVQGDPSTRAALSTPLSTLTPTPLSLVPAQRDARDSRASEHADTRTEATHDATYDATYDAHILTLAGRGAGA